MDNLLLYGGLALTAWLMLKPKKDDTSKGGSVAAVKRSLSGLKTVASNLPDLNTSSSGLIDVTVAPEHELLTPVQIEQYTVKGGVPPGSDYVVINGVQIQVTRSGEYWYDEAGHQYTKYEVYQA